MDTLERELQRTLHSVHTDRPMPDGLRQTLRRRTRRRMLRNGGVVATSMVAAVALVTAGGVYLGQLSGAEPAASGPTELTWSEGRVTVDEKLDDGVAADSVLGFLDRTHAVVEPYGAESGDSIRMQVVDLTTGEGRVFLDEPRERAELGYVGQLSDGAYVWVQDGKIHAIDVGSGRRWVVSDLVPKPVHLGELTPEQFRESNKPVQFAVGSGYVVWRNYTEGEEKVFARAVGGGERRQLPGIADTAVLAIDAGRVAAYDGETVKVFDLDTGELVRQRPFARVPATDKSVVEATCGVQYCVRGTKAGDGARLDLMRISDGTSIPVPDAPVIEKVVERGEQGRVVAEGPPMTPQIVGAWLAFGTGATSPKETRYLYDIEGTELRKIGDGQFTLTADGYAVEAESLKTDHSEGSVAAGIEIRYGELPR